MIKTGDKASFLLKNTLETEAIFTTMSMKARGRGGLKSFLLGCLIAIFAQKSSEGP